MANIRETQTRTDDRAQQGRETREGSQQQGRGLQRSETSPGMARWRDPFDAFGFGPFSMLRRMQEDMDRLFGDTWGAWRWPAGGGEIGHRAEWAPAIEAFQRGNEFIVRAEVPGLRREDLSVEVGDDELTIQGERRYDHEEEREGVFRSERRYGSFCRIVPLPEGAVAESARADFKDGVLEVVLQAPSHEVRRGRRVEIGSAQANQSAGRKPEEQRAGETQGARDR